MLDNKEELKNKIIYRSSYRGTKEMDILVSSFVKSIIDQLEYDDLILLNNFIKIDDEITVNNRGSFRSGKITDISLSLLTNDPAGENGIQTQIYDTAMGYNGSIGYVTENGDHYWAYFSQIETDI